MKNIKRAELHLHTKLSDDISVIGVEEIFEEASQIGLNTVAFTNLDNVQDFPAIAKAHKGYSDLKVIYGAEVRYKNEVGKAPYGLTLIAKNQAGIKELYKIISSIENDGVCDLIDIEVLKKNRKNLLVGSCGNIGELYETIIQGATKEKIYSFYDYFEIYPTNDEIEKGVYKRIYELGEEVGVPVVAAGNCHYLAKEDKICCDIIKAVRNQEIDEKSEYYIRTTKQMLEEFSYLGNFGAQKVVLENPQIIANLIEKAVPMKEGWYSPIFENAVLNLQNLCYSRAYEIYGNPLPKTVEKRLSEELDKLQYDDFATQYLIAKKLAAYAKAKEQRITARGSVGSVFVAFLIGVSETNPLPPHYFCSHCHYFEEVKDIRDGFDLPDKSCPVCHKPLKSDGHNMPCETFMGNDGSKMPDIDLNFPVEFLSEIQNYMSILFDKMKIAQARTIATLTETRAKEYISEYENITKIKLKECEKKNILSKIIDVKSSIGIHPSGIMIIPEDMDYEDFTPIDSSCALQPATHFEFHDLHNTILKQDILGHTTLDLLLKLEKRIGESVNDIKWNDPLIYEMFQKSDTLCIPEFDTDFVQNMIIKTEPKDFNDLVKIIGLCHGTNVWTDNGELLVEKGVPISKIPCFREDIMNDLIKTGTNITTAYLCSEKTRKGFFARGRADSQIVETFKTASKPIDEWYYNYCSKIRYMFPKAHAVAYVMNAVRCAWFKLYYPVEFYAEYLSCYFQSDEELTKEDKTRFQKIVDECLAKGIQLLKPDVDKSHPKNYLLENGNIRMPHIK